MSLLTLAHRQVWLAHRQVWLAQSPISEPCWRPLRTLPVVPGELFGPATQQALDRGIQANQTRQQFASLRGATSLPRQQPPQGYGTNRPLPPARPSGYLRTSPAPERPYQTHRAPTRPAPQAQRGRASGFQAPKRGQVLTAQGRASGASPSSTSSAGEVALQTLGWWPRFPRGTISNSDTGPQFSGGSD